MILPALGFIVTAPLACLSIGFPWTEAAALVFGVLVLVTMADSRTRRLGMALDGLFLEALGIRRDHKPGGGEANGLDDWGF